MDKNNVTFYPYLLNYGDKKQGTPFAGQSLNMMLPACVILLFSILGVQSTCPDGWQDLGETCYLMGTTNMNWFAARQFCAHSGGHLAEFDTSEEMLELLPLFYEGNVHSYELWIGLNSLIEEDTWMYDYSGIR